MKLAIRGGRILDPALNLDAAGDLLIEVGKIRGSADETIDAANLLVVPGLVDMHVHLREPGDDEEETIASGAAAAAAGGFTSVACMPNTDPPIDSRSAAEFVYQQAARAGAANVFPIGAITKGRRGEELSEMGSLVAGGAVAFSDDGDSVADSGLMRRGLEYAKMFGRPIISHCEDKSLSGDGNVNESEVSAILGFDGMPAAAEEIMIWRDIRIAELTGGRLHVAHVSTAGAVELIRVAKAKGLSVSAEATPHHLLLTDELVKTFDSNYKMNPPLRTARDAAALREGLRDGTIDAIASDHAPHTPEEKEVEFTYAPYGVIGLESTLAMVLSELVGEGEGKLDLGTAIRAMTQAPARILGLGRKGTLAVGSDADVTIIDLAARWEIDPAAFKSKARNCPFAGRRVKGKAAATIVGGRVVRRP